MSESGESTDQKAGGLLRMSVVEPSGKLYGSELALLDILEGLDRPVFQTEVVLPRNAPFSEKLREGGIPYVELLPYAIRDCSRLGKALSYWRLMMRWRRQRPNLIYVNQGGILRPVAAIAKRLGIPMLCQVQTLEDAKWVGSLGSCHPLISTFVCNSQFTADHCRVPAERLSTVYHGYKPKRLSDKGFLGGRAYSRAQTSLGDTRKQGSRGRSPSHTGSFQTGSKALYREPAPDCLNQGRLEVGLLGRICEGKGHYLVVEAAGLLKKSGGHGFHFRFIGEPATPEERRRIESAVQQQGLTDWVEFRGYRSDIAAEFGQMDLLAIPATAAEAFGRTLFEAAEARVPVLLADAGGLGEIAQRFNVGIRFTPGNAGDFVRQLQWIAGNYEHVRAEFIPAGERLLRALELPSYLAVMSDLIRQSAGGGPVSREWLGKLEGQRGPHSHYGPDRHAG